MEKFILDGQYGKILDGFGVKVEEALRKAKLPEDFFSHKRPAMTVTEYYRFMDAIGHLVDDHQTLIKIVSTDELEQFSPPVFAAYCSKNGRKCIERLGRYKRLIGPMNFWVTEEGEMISVEITAENEVDTMPQFLVETEIVFLLGIIRKATKENINPIVVKMQKPVRERVFLEFCGCDVKQCERNQIVYKRSDLEMPFITRNDAMWDYFEPELNRRLAEFEIRDTYSARVQSALMELLPGGYSGIEDVAKKLGISKRTLQRRLWEENTCYKEQLIQTRKKLAVHYIQNSDMTGNEIAYLLGYQESNSFLRAFNAWTGESISEYRKQQSMVRSS